MADRAEALMYLQSCWKHVHTINKLSKRENIENPVSVAHQVQAYLNFIFPLEL